MEQRARLVRRITVVSLGLMGLAWGAMVFLGSSPSENENRGSSSEEVASASIDRDSGHGDETEEVARRRRVDPPQVSPKSPETKPGVEHTRKIDAATIQKAMLDVFDSIQQSRMEFATAVKDGEPASRIAFLRNILERLELGLAKIRRGEYVEVPAAEAMKARNPGDPDYSAYPTSLIVDGSVLYLKVIFNDSEARDLSRKRQGAGKQRWIEANAEIASHNKLRLQERKVRVLRSDEAKAKMLRMRKVNRTSVIPDISAYMRKLQDLRAQELPWYFSI